MTEHTVTVRRVMPVEEAEALIGTDVADFLEPTFTSPWDGDRVRVIDEATGDTIALVTRISTTHRGPLRRFVNGRSYSGDVARHNRGGRQMSVAGSTFGYAPAKAIARQEGCRMTRLGRDEPEGEALLERLAGELSAEFDVLLPDQALADRNTLADTILDDWRLGESTWTSGVINRANVLPYHRDGNNLDTWSAMPTLRYRMTGGHLHLPEYGLVFPCGDGDVTWFYGRGIVHGVTPMQPIGRDAYRYSLVYYALRGLKNCATYAEETRLAASRRTAREVDMAAAIRTSYAADRPADAVLADLAEFARLELAAGDIEPWADLIGALPETAVNDEERLWLIALYNSYDDLHSAWSVFRRWSTPRAWAAAPDRDDAALYPCTQERRGLRGGKVLKRHQSYVDVLGDLTQRQWVTSAMTGEPLTDYRGVMALTRMVWGVGRQSAFEWAEFLAKAAGVKITAPDAELWESEGPRRSLQRIFGNPDPSLAWLNEQATIARAHVDTTLGVTLSWEDFETLICDFNVMRDGRYYPGRHLAALREEIELVDPADRPLLDAAWTKIVPPEWASIPPGIDKSLLPVYRDTGRIIDHP